MSAEIQQPTPQLLPGGNASGTHEFPVAQRLPNLITRYSLPLPVARKKSTSLITPPPPPLSGWKMYKDKIRVPVVLLLHDATIVLIVLALNGVILLFLRGVEMVGVPTWFTHNVERVDLFSALINVTIFAVDTTGKIFAASIKGFKDEPTI